MKNLVPTFESFLNEKKPIQYKSHDKADLEKLMGALRDDVDDTSNIKKVGNKVTFTITDDQGPEAFEIRIKNNEFFLKSANMKEIEMDKEDLNGDITVAYNKIKLK